MTGKVVLITGAAGGIGAGLARGFAAAGARLVLADLNDKVHVLLKSFGMRVPMRIRWCSTSPMNRQ